MPRYSVMVFARLERPPRGDIKVGGHLRCPRTPINKLTIILLRVESDSNKIQGPKICRGGKDGTSMVERVPVAARRETSQQS